MQKIAENTYSIIEHGPAGPVRMYLLVGQTQALLIDCGYGLLDLMQIIRSVTDKPVTLAITHGHLDHALGSRQFEQAYLHSADFPVLQDHRTAFMQKAYDLKYQKALKRGDEKAKEAYRKMEELKANPGDIPLPLEDIEAFDLGGRIIRWVHTPGHTPGSVCFYDETNHLLFSGDTLSRMAWLSLPESLSLTTYGSSLVQLKSIVMQKQLTYCYGGHGGKASSIKSIRHLSDCATLIAQKRKKGFHVNLGLTQGNLAFRRGFMVLYKPEGWTN